VTDFSEVLISSNMRAMSDPDDGVRNHLRNLSISTRPQDATFQKTVLFILVTGEPDISTNRLLHRLEFN
jgi:hypothetical protein